MQAVILAAGYATRLGAIAQGRAKALMPIGTRPIINFIYDDLKKIDAITDIHVVSNALYYEQFLNWQAQLPPDRVRVHVWNDQTTSNADRLGAIGDLMFTIEKGHIDDDLFVAAGDNFFTFPLSQVVDSFRASGKDTICVSHFADRSLLTRFAVAVLDENGDVLDMEEKPQVPKSDIGVYALYVYRRETLSLLKSYRDAGQPMDAPGHFPAWLCARENPLHRDVHAFAFAGECIDIGTPESYKDACERFGKA